VTTRFSRLYRDRRGVTLVELLVATAIFTIVAVAVGSLYVSTQRAFDYGFSLRSWHQNVWRYRKRKTPEFLSSKNARYRLALQSARGKS